MSANDASRREFLKGLGITGVGLGVLGPLGLTLSGEVVRNEGAGDVHTRPWWVRSVDKPTTGIDWDIMKRFNGHIGHTSGAGWSRFVGSAKDNLLSQIQRVNLRERAENDVPGYTLPDQALQGAFQASYRDIPLQFLGPQRAQTPAERGVPRWEGTPEDAARIVKAALRLMGAANIGVVHLDERTRKLFYSVDRDGKRIEFENVEQAYETDDKRVIPYGAEWAIVYSVQMSAEAIRRAPTAISNAGTFQAYYRGYAIQRNLQEFLRGLGYQGLGHTRSNSLGVLPAFAVMGGLGELARSNRVITPEYGPLVRLFLTVTDLPMEPDRPINAGIAQFCRVCKKCAEACPPGALSFDTEPGWEPVGAYSNTGHEAWFEDCVKCKTYWRKEAGTDCSICFAVCPFAKKDRTFIHKFVKMNVAHNNEALDSIIRSVDDAFGYGEQKDAEEWWDLDLPDYGIDTTQGKHR